LDLAGRKIERIMVRATNWVGDAVMTTPALAALRDNFPEASLTVLAHAGVAPVFADHPAVDDILLFDSRGRHRGVSGVWRMARQIDRARFDLAVLFQNAFRAALTVRLAGVPLRLGYDTDGRGFLLNRPIRLEPGDKQVHETEYYLRILARAGLRAESSLPAFHYSGAVRDRASERLKRLGLDRAFLLGIAPGAAYGTAKRWPAERFAEAADRILKRTDGTALIFGGLGEAEAAFRVREAMTSPAVSLAGETDLAEAAALIARCRLFLTNDSGLMHVASAVGVPLVAVFGSTNPVTTSPRGGPVRLIRHPVECSPCLKPVCDRPGHPCMDRVRPGEVAMAGLGLLDETRPE